MLHELSLVHGSDFEAVDVSSLMISPDSAAVKFTPIVSVSAVKPSASEQGPVNGTFRCTGVGGLNVSVKVFYVLGGTAANGADYARLSGSVVIPAGAATADVLVKPVDDALREGTITVIVNIAKNQFYTVGSPASAKVAIADNY